MPTILNVLFSEKSAAKAMGARWDGASRAWFIPDSIDPAPFTGSIRTSIGRGRFKKAYSLGSRRGRSSDPLFVYINHVCPVLKILCQTSIGIWRFYWAQVDVKGHAGSKNKIKQFNMLHRFCTRMDDWHMRALKASEAIGRGFESLRARQFPLGQIGNPPAD